MPWFAWLYVVAFVACCAFVGWCAWDIYRITKRMDRR